MSAWSHVAVALAGFVLRGRRRARVVVVAPIVTEPEPEPEPAEPVERPKPRRGIENQADLTAYRDRRRFRPLDRPHRRVQV